MFEAQARGDAPGSFRFLDEQITWDARGIPMPEMRGIYYGHDGVRTWWRAWFEAWERIDIIDGAHHRPHGNQVVSWWRQRNLGKGSGIAVEQEAGFVWTFQDGLIVRAAAFVSREDVFRAAGLEP
jgi:ketosteroid isomerase-like protein